MTIAQAFLYLAAVVLLIVAAFRPPVAVSLVCLAGASALLAFALPTLHAGL